VHAVKRRVSVSLVPYTPAWLITREVEWKMKARNCDAETLFGEKPELLKRYCEAVSIKVGNKIIESD
jgi:hypothetical protein